MKNCNCRGKGIACDRCDSKPSYWDNICAMQQKQTEKGIATYGQTLEQNTSLSDIERLTYLEEELIDALMYIEHLKVKLHG